MERLQLLFKALSTFSRTSISEKQISIHSFSIVYLVLGFRGNSLRRGGPDTPPPSPKLPLPAHVLDNWEIPKPTSPPPTSDVFFQVGGVAPFLWVTLEWLELISYCSQRKLSPVSTACISFILSVITHDHKLGYRCKLTGQLTTSLSYSAPSDLRKPTKQHHLPSATWFCLEILTIKFMIYSIEPCYIKFILGMSSTYCWESKFLLRLCMDWIAHSKRLDTPYSLSNSHRIPQGTHLNPLQVHKTHVHMINSHAQSNIIERIKSSFSTWLGWKVHCASLL